MKKTLLVSCLLLLNLFFIGKIRKNMALEEVKPLSLMERQQMVSEMIQQTVDDYTLDEPNIIINPYEISPLTALIAFKTSEPMAFEVNVNDEYTFKTDNTSRHIIAIYYLRANYDNLVTFKSMNTTMTYHLKTTNLDIKEMNVQKAKTEKSLYFTSSSHSSLLYSAFDGKGDMVWHLDMPSQGSLHFLDDKTFLVAAPDYVTQDGAYFTHLYKMDLLGRIFADYALPYLYHHDLTIVDDTAFILGGPIEDDDLPFSSVYRLDLKTGEVIDYRDIEDIIRNLDNDWNDHRSTLKNGLYINSIDYDKTTNSLLLSIRNLNMIICINYDTLQVKWILADPKSLSMETQKYLLKADKNFVYPYGQHQARFIDTNTISYYNNGFTSQDISSFKIGDYEPRPAGAQIIGIANQKIAYHKDIWEEDGKFSYAYGGVQTFNNRYLITFSYLFKDDYIESNGNIFDFIDHTYSRIIEYNHEGHVTFKAEIPDLLYRSEWRNPLANCTYYFN